MAGLSVVGDDMLYRLGRDGVLPVPITSAAEEQLLEADLEDWTAAWPDVLGEELLVIGRQVAIGQGQDRVDLLALDLAANLVVIELKRELIGSDADLQAVRYASMVSRWDHATIRRLAESYWASTGQGREGFTHELDKFCDADYEVNANQRIILAGRTVSPRLATMSLWLRERGVDVRVITMGLYRDEGSLYLQPQVLIPIPTEDAVAASPEPRHSDKEWMKDGRSWHLEEQLAADGRAIVERIVDLVASAVPQAAGPVWTQKHYIVWKHGARGWLRCYTNSPHQAALMLWGLKLEPNEVAGRLGWKEFDPEAELATKLAWSSSVGRGRHGQLRLIIKTVEDIDACSEELAGILQEAWQGAGGQERGT